MYFDDFHDFYILSTLESVPRLESGNLIEKVFSILSDLFYFIELSPKFDDL